MAIVRDSFVYLFSSIIAKLSPFILMPFLTRYLAPEDFGRLSITLVFTQIATALVGMSMQTNVAKNFYVLSKEKLSNVVGSVIIILIFLGTIYTIFLVFIFFAKDVFFSIPTSLLVLLPLVAVFTTLYQIYLSLLRVEGRVFAYGVSEISFSILSASLTFLLLVSLEENWVCQFYGIALANLFFSFISFIYLFRYSYIRFRVSWVEIRGVFRFSYPLIPHVIGGMIISVSDRVIIERMVGLSEVAYYSIGYSFGMILALVSDAFIKAWGPWFYKNIVNAGHERKISIVKITYIYIICLFFVALMLSFIAKVILPYVVSEDYYASAIYIRWVALGYFFHGIYKIFFPYLVHLNKTRILAISTSLAALVNIVLNFILIGYFGTIGAAYATVLAFMVSSCFVFLYQKSKIEMPWRLGRV